jgi:hypothetical protein
MRNVLEYPITKAEVVSALYRAVENELRSGRIGGIDSAALMLAKEFIIDNGPEIFYEKFDPRSQNIV